MEMSGTQRRKKILDLIRETKVPLSGGALGKATGVSRQVVVQDIALLRTEGHPIIATARGYLFNQPSECVRLFKVCHTSEETEQELTMIVDLGGCVMDVIVNHRAYGQMSAPLSIRSRRDVQLFMEQIRTGKSVPLSTVTSGYHFHHVSAESEEVLDEIQARLKDMNFLAEILPYERETI